MAKVSIGDLVIDVLAHSVTQADTPLRLTPKEFELLAILARHAGRVVTHAQILTTVWGPAHVEDIQYLRTFVGQLRQKLKPSTDATALIQTEPGIGYRLVG